MKNKREESLPTSEFNPPNIPRRKRSCLKSPSSADKHGVGGERRDEDARTGGGAVNFHSKNGEKSERYLEEVKETFRNQPEKIDAFNQVLRDLKAASAGALVRFKELLKGHKNLVHGLKKFLLEEYGASLDRYDDPPDEVGLYEDAENLLKKIKQRFHNQEHIFKRFLDTVNMHPKQPRGMNEIYKEFSALFVDDPDFFEECKKFVRDGSALSQQERMWKMKKNLKRHVENENSKTSSHYQGEREMEPENIIDLNLPPFPYDENVLKLGKSSDVPDPMDHFDQFLEQCENIESQIVGGHVKQMFTLEDENKEHSHEVEIGKKAEDCGDKYSGKTIYEHCTPSYQFLPEDYRTLLASQRSNPGVVVLNDHCVSIESGSEGHSFKHICNNKYEKNLLSCEDYRFELDVLLENMKSTVTCGESLLNRIIEGDIHVDGLIRLEDYFTTMNFRCIERVYDDDGGEAIDLLRQNPALGLPIILARLNRRLEEWLQCRAEFNVTWAETYAENDHMARDHRSMYFKDQDINKLKANSLISDIKKLRKKRQKEDVHQAIDADHQQPMRPHLKFKYNDASIHKDLRKLVHIQCEEMCPKKQHNKIMRLWSNFFEKFLGFYKKDPVGSDVKLDKKLIGIERNHKRLKASVQVNNDDACKAQHGNGSLPVGAMKKEEKLNKVKWENSGKNAEMKPCAKYMSTKEEKKRDSRIFFGNDDFYVLFRLHQSLYERILLAKRKSAVADKKSRISKASGSPDSYARFISILCDFLKGSADNAEFENECVEIIGNSSYMLFTLDFVIGKLVKRLEVIEKSEKDNKLLEIYGYKGPSKRWYGINTVHHEMATNMLHGRNIYRFECSFSPARLSIELMDKDAENHVLNC